jgi:hypothetical protein
VTGITGGAIMAGGVIAGASLALTDALPALVLVVALIGLTVMIIIAVALAVLAATRRTRYLPGQPGEGCDDDGTGNCPCQAGDDEIERIVRTWKEANDA